MSLDAQVFARVGHWIVLNWSKLKKSQSSRSILCQSHGQNMCVCGIISEIELSFTSDLNDFQRFEKNVKFVVFSRSLIYEIHDLFAIYRQSPLMKNRETRDSVLKWAEEWQKALNLKLLRGAIGEQDKVKA